MSITKAEFNSLSSDSITKKEYDRIIDTIDDDVDAIIRKIWRDHNGRGWWAYANCDYDSEDGDSEFDPKRYKETIELGGEYYDFPAPYDDKEIPTRWLWEDDWYKEFEKEVAKTKIENIAKNIADKEKAKEKQEYRKNMMAQIKKKLTVEEVKFLGWPTK